MNLFVLEVIDIGSPKLRTIDIFSQTTSHKHLVILAFIGAELAGGYDSEPHSRAWIKTGPARGGEGGFSHLPEFLDNSKLEVGIDAKLSVSSIASIWRRPSEFQKIHS